MTCATAVLFGLNVSVFSKTCLNGGGDEPLGRSEIAVTTQTFDKYEFQLPDGWEVSGRFPILIVFKPDGVGTLRFFSFEPDNPTRLDHWLDFRGQIPAKVSTIKDDKVFSKTWLVTEPNGAALSVNYRCHPSQADIELNEVDQIVATLRRIS